MPILVSIVKQFLMIRGLNDNAVGGFGGFATICMVTSIIQNYPTRKSPNLGELLTEFFNLYGNLLDYRNVGVQMDPPGYLDKVCLSYEHSYNFPPCVRPLKLLQYRAHADEKRERLMIIDPHDPTNNITGGSNQVDRIFGLFSRAYGTLQEKLDEYATNQTQGNFSFLEELIGGNFTAYYQQRRALYSVYKRSNPNSGEPLIFTNV